MNKSFNLFSYRILGAGSGLLNQDMFSMEKVCVFGYDVGYYCLNKRVIFAYNSPQGQLRNDLKYLMLFIL